jgi:hypothetical protein
MITERETTQMSGQFLAKRLDGAIYLSFALAVVSTILGISVLGAGVESETLANSSQTTADADWSELIVSMDKMHMAMGAIKRSGNADADFVRLMVPHHQAAIDMHFALTLLSRKWHSQSPPEECSKTPLTRHR